MEVVVVLEPIKYSPPVSHVFNRLGEGTGEMGKRREERGKREEERARKEEKECETMEE